MFILESKFEGLTVPVDPRTGVFKEDFYGNKKVRSIKFVNRFFKTEDPELVDALKRHGRFGIDFWLMDQKLTREVLASNNEIAITTEDLTLSFIDRENLKLIESCKDKITVDVNKVVGAIEELLERFKISTLQAPGVKSKETRIRLVIHEILDLLEAESVWPEEKGLDEAELISEDYQPEVEKPSNARNRANRKSKASN